MNKTGYTESRLQESTTSLNGLNLFPPSSHQVHGDEISISVKAYSADIFLPFYRQQNTNLFTIDIGDAMTKWPNLVNHVLLIYTNGLNLHLLSEIISP